MTKDTAQKHVPVPKNTPAFICANCGAVSLDREGICKVQGKGTKADWCGTPTSTPPRQCVNHVHNLRFTCGNCGTVAVNPELLCSPERLSQ